MRFLATIKANRIEHCMSKDKKISYKDLEEKLLQPEDALLNDLSRPVDANIPDSIFFTSPDSILITSSSGNTMDCSSSASSKSCASSFSTSG